MKNPYLLNSDEYKQWEVKNEIYETGQKLIKDMKEFIFEKILFVRQVCPRKQKREGDYIAIGKKYYDTHLIVDYKTQHNDIIYLQIEGKDFDNWKKLKEGLR